MKFLLTISLSVALIFCNVPLNAQEKIVTSCQDHYAFSIASNQDKTPQTLISKLFKKKLKDVKDYLITLIKLY